MADDRTKKGPADSGKININEDYEVDYWTDKLGCTKDQLIKAAKEAGTSAKAVRAYLNK